MTGTSVNPFEYGANIGLRSILATYIGEGGAAKWAYENPLGAQLTFTPSSTTYTNPYDSIFKQQTTTSPLMNDLNSSLFGQQVLTGTTSDVDVVAQYLQSSVDSQIAQATKSFLSKLFGSSQTTTSPLQNLDQDDVSDARQDEVDKISKKHSTQRDCAKLETDLTSGDKEKINKALRELAGFSEAKFSAFQQYLEDKSTDLDTILAAAEKIDGVKSEKIDKVFDKCDKAEAWLNADDVEEALSMSEVGADADEVAEMRQEKVEDFAESHKAERSFKKLDEALATTDKDELNKALKDIRKFSNKEIMAFQQYLEAQGKDLETILANVEKVDGVKVSRIDDILDNYDNAQDWLDAIDIEEE